MTTGAQVTTDQMARILDLVVEALGTGLTDPATTAAHLAERAHLSRSHFDRLVGAATGEPPGALRRRLLLERSAYRLISSTTGVLDVAVEAGYGSHEAFTRAFSRAYGLAPSAVRRHPPRTFRDLELPCPSGVHFQPPGTLRLPAPREESSVDVLRTLVHHHVDTLTAVIERAATLPDDRLDQPIVTSIELIDDDPTLRSLIGGMVTQEEHWLSALRGGRWPDDTDDSVTGLAARHAVAGRDYREVVDAALDEGRLADTFVDTTCEPPATHTLGGMIGHVVTFAAVRRTLAVGALATYGIDDLGAADPRPLLDGTA